MIVIPRGEGGYPQAVIAPGSQHAKRRPRGAGKMSLSPENIALCQHIKANDTRCASPALRGRKFCYFHKQERQKQLEASANIRRERRKIRLPIPQDAESIKMAWIKVMQLSV